MAVNVLSPLHVRETSPGTHTFFHTYTCPVYCWRSVQLLDFSLSCGLIHASQPIRTSFTGQCFASGFLQTPPHGDALAFGCILPTAGRIWDFHPLERAPAGHTRIYNRRDSRHAGCIERFLPVRPYLLPLTMLPACKAVSATAPNAAHYARSCRP